MTGRGLKAGVFAASMLALAACGSGGAPSPSAPTEAPDAAVYEDDERSFAAQGGEPGATGGEGAAAPDQPGDFDYYLLALSWSPSYCAGEGAAERDPLQCAAERPFSFIVHGLWPQRERGWPQDCPTAQQTVAAPLVDDMLDLMPSPRLVEHQWDKHGSCTGLSQEAYFETVRRFRDDVTIPPAFTRLSERRMVTGEEVEAAFIAANPGLDADEMVVACNRGRLREVRLCMTPQGAFRQCGQDVRDSCGDRPAAMLPVRGS